MSQQISSIPLIKKVCKTTLQFFKNNPALFLPFIIFAAVESIALILCYFAPRTPLIFIFGPIIRTFWGERFLHYPFNFFLLPKLTSLSRFALSTIFGSLLTGMAVAIAFDIYNKKEVNLKASFKSAAKKYIDLFTIVFIFSALFYFLVKIIAEGLLQYFLAGHSKLLFLKPALWMGPILLCINFIIALFIQSAFIYAIPLLIIGKEKLIHSITGSFRLFFKKLLIPTLILVGLPMLIYIPIVLLNYNPAILIDKFFPEFILVVLFLGIVISSLIIDPIVTISTASLYLISEQK